MTREEALGMRGPHAIADPPQDRATGGSVDRHLAHLVAADADLAVTEAVTAEVPAGARTGEREAQLRRLLDRCAWLPFQAETDVDGAVRVHRTCRAAGVTPRGLVDCLIAAVASRTGAALLSADVDLARIADVVDLQLDVPPS